MRRPLSVAHFLAIFSSVALHAQIPIAPGTPLFGDGVVRKIRHLQRKPFGSVAPLTDEEKKERQSKANGKTEVLIFQGERQLRGELVSMDKDSLAWSRPDASGPLHFSKAEVRRIVTAPMVFDPTEEKSANENKPSPPKPIRATVKLAGADWLFGDLTSDDGQSFSLRIDAKTSFTIPREAIEWLYFDSQPAPALGFLGQMTDTDGWLEESRTDFHLDGKNLAIEDGYVFGSIPQTKRVMVTVEVPKEYEQDLFIELTPSAHYAGVGSGEIDINVEKSELSGQVYAEEAMEQRAPLPGDSGKASANVVYQVLYDDPTNRVVVLRNGSEILKFALWKRGGEPHESKHGITEISVQRRQKPLRFVRVDVAPWDGIVPKYGEAPARADATETVEKIGASKITFSEGESPITSGMLVKFPKAPASFEGVENLLSFGGSGRLGVRDLRVEGGLLHARSSFATKLGLPVGAVQTIYYPRAPLPKRSDFLVFKDGDELAGMLVSADLGGPLHWRTNEKQKIIFQPENIGGVRFAALPSREAVQADPAIIDLRNGDRLRGEVRALDDQKLQIVHSQFGALALDRDRLWKLYPDPRVVEFCGSRSDNELLDLNFWNRPERKESDPKPSGSIWLDGAITTRTRGWNYYLRDGAPTKPDAHIGLDCYEVDFDVADPYGRSPKFELQLYNKERSSIVFLLASGELKTYPKLQNMVTGRKTNLEGQVPESQVHLRALVNSRVGSVDVFVNGKLAGSTGTGRVFTERIPSIGECVTVDSVSDYGEDDSEIPPEIVSNVWIGPWDGDLTKKPEKPVVMLGNGDVATGSIASVKDEKLTIVTDAGPLTAEFGKTRMIDFAKTTEPKKTPARVRLPDGSVINVSACRFVDGELIGQSESIGDFKLPANALDELIFDPALPRFPE